MAYVVLARQLAFQPVDPANPTVPTGPEELVERGGFIPDYATTGLINALNAAGLVAWVDRERPDLVPVGSDPVQVRTLDQPVILPSDPNGQAPVVGDVVPAVEPVPSQQVPDLPKNGDSKEVWENYAQLPHIGMSQVEAEGMSKTDLVAEVRRRNSAAATA